MFINSSQLSALSFSFIKERDTFLRSFSTPARSFFLVVPTGRIALRSQNQGQGLLLSESCHPYGLSSQSVRICRSQYADLTQLLSSAIRANVFQSLAHY